MIFIFSDDIDEYSLTVFDENTAKKINKQNASGVGLEIHTVDVFQQ